MRSWTSSPSTGAAARMRGQVGLGSLKRRLSEVDEPDQRRLLTQELRAQIASTLSYDEGQRLEMDLSFPELGFDSLLALDLRNRLQSLTRLTLPSSLLFDHPTPAALVDHLHGLLRSSADGDDTASPPASSNGRDALTADGDGAAAVTSMFRRAHQLGKLTDGIALAEAASRLRPRFGLSHVELEAPNLITLARGDERPALFCFPSVVATAGPHEYVR